MKRIALEIESAFNHIINSEVFRLNGHKINLPESIIALCDAINASETDENIWTLGEFAECTLGDMIVAAHWAFSEWHAGQWSDSYRALCSTGSIFSPGMTSGPEPDSPEHYAYDAFGQWCNDNQSKL